jgi:hypothetical protein
MALVDLYPVGGLLYEKTETKTDAADYRPTRQVGSLHEVESTSPLRPRESLSSRWHPANGDNSISLVIQDILASVGLSMGLLCAVCCMLRAAGVSFDIALGVLEDEYGFT